MTNSIESIVTKITKTQSRKSLFHFTRVSNLAAIAHFNALFSSQTIKPTEANERRVTAEKWSFGGQDITLNVHLRIADSVIDPAVTKSNFGQV